MIPLSLEGVLPSAFFDTVHLRRTEELNALSFL